MSNLKSRVVRLEDAKPKEEIVLAYVPRGFLEDDCEDEVERLVEAAGHRGAFSYLILEHEDASEPIISYVGSTDEFLGDIGRYGRRIIETDEQYRARVGDNPPFWKGNRA